LIAPISTKRAPGGIPVVSVSKTTKSRGNSIREVYFTA